MVYQESPPRRARQTSIAAENARTGSAEWWGAPHARSGEIEAYTSQPSVIAGDALGLCVSTSPVARYRARIFRLGWYGGAGGRLMATLPGNIGLAREAPVPDPVTGIIRACWPVTDVVQTEEDWPSGQYVVVLELTSGRRAKAASRVPFVVRALPGEAAPTLVQTPINTAAAYNNWGGKSLYESNSSDEIPAVKVSFARPVPAWEIANLNARAPFIYELPLIRWLEREGFDVSYQTNVDTHRDPSSLTGPRVLISAGHDEYWTKEMRDAFDDALGRGVSLAFMGANTCYWQIRYEDGERTIVAYRDRDRDPHPHHALKTVLFRDLRRPERDLIGVQYEGGIGSPSEPQAYTFDPAFARDPWADGIDLEPGRSLERLVGYEWDTLDERHARPQTVRIMHHDAQGPSADCIRWTATSGARVFAAGSLQFAWGLDDWPSPHTADARVQHLLRVGLGEMLS
jgi:hypothetical protein